MSRENYTLLLETIVTTMHLNWNAPWQHAGDHVRGGDDAKSSIEQGKAQPNAPYIRESPNG